MTPPTHIGVILRKNKPTLYIDAIDLERFAQEINKNDFVYLRNYQCTVHKFDIEEMKISKMTKTIEQDLERLSKRLIDLTQPTLSLDHYLWNSNHSPTKREAIS